VARREAFAADKRRRPYGSRTSVDWGVDVPESTPSSRSFVFLGIFWLAEEYSGGVEDEPLVGASFALSVWGVVRKCAFVRRQNTYRVVEVR
jgi:hypothetical protein